MYMYNFSSSALAQLLDAVTNNKNMCDGAQTRFHFMFSKSF